MLTRTVLATNSIIDGLPTRLSSTLATTLLLIVLTPAHATNSSATAYTKNLTDSIDQKSLTLRAKDQQQIIDGMLTQLQQYQQKEYSARQQYLAYKAQAWLNYATHEHNINGESATGRHALQMGSRILTALKTGTDEQVNLTPDIPSISTLMRPDLWATLNALKNSGGIAQAPRELAFSEVALIWAAAEQCEHGWRQSGTYFRMSERWLEQAREAYVNAHNSQTNVALEERINHYFKQYTLLDNGEDKCQGQVLPRHIESMPQDASSDTPLSHKSSSTSANTKLNAKLDAQSVTTVIDGDAVQIEITRSFTAVQLPTDAPPMPVPTTPYQIINQ